MKKTTKRFISFLSAVVLVFFSFPITFAHATKVTQAPPNGGWARIRYACNGRYLDIPAEGFYNNGTQLQVWDKVYGNQNQIFYFYDTGNGWRISSPLTDKVIEVRNSSHDDYAEVAQWDAHDLACSRWDIIANTDGTVSFRNRESGLYLNVCGGGDAQNGTKIIQYHDDGTIAMKFYLEAMTYGDVLSATFSRNIQNSEIKWTSYRPFGNIINDTGWEYRNNGNYYYPTLNQSRIFSSVEYLSPNTVANLLRDKSYSESTWNKIESALKGDLTEAGIMALLKELEFDDIPGIGTAIGILQILWNSQEAEQWNRFVDSVSINPQGRCSGIIVYTYYNITDVQIWGPLNNGTTAWGTTHHIRKIPFVEYKTWTGDNFNEVCNLPVNVASGRWYYYFK